ncbi:MAG TPA: hypothetical protein VE978_21950 [Chitinophagales bacterium]|nr:hypothetical protein [Chitinophagales bacterium]
MKPFHLLFIITLIFSSCSLKDSHRGNYNITFTITSANRGIQKFSAETASDIFHRRLLLYGLKEKQMSITGNGTTITIELTRVDDTLWLKNLIEAQGQLELRETYSNLEFFNTLSAINASLARHNLPAEKNNPVNPLGTGVPTSLPTDSTPAAELKQNETEDPKESNPLLNKLNAAVELKDNHYHLRSGAEIGYCLTTDTAEVMQMLTRDSVKALIPFHVQFHWSLNPNFPADSHSLYALNYDSAGTPFMSGAIVKQANLDYNAEGKPQISIVFNDIGTKEFYLMTKRNIDKNIAILIDGDVVSAPRVIGEVKGGRASITGGDENELRILCAILQSGFFSHKTIMKVH